MKLMNQHITNTIKPVCYIASKYSPDILYIILTVTQVNTLDLSRFRLSKVRLG